MLIGQALKAQEIWTSESDFDLNYNNSRIEDIYKAMILKFNL